VSSPAREPEYLCGACGTTWAYRAVRHTARCRDCGGGLVRDVLDMREHGRLPDARPLPVRRPQAPPRAPVGR
jgi:hypothetical protein